MNQPTRESVKVQLMRALRNLCAAYEKNGYTGDPAYVEALKLLASLPSEEVLAAQHRETEQRMKERDAEIRALYTAFEEAERDISTERLLQQTADACRCSVERVCSALKRSLEFLVTVNGKEQKIRKENLPYEEIVTMVLGAGAIEARPTVTYFQRAIGAHGAVNPGETLWLSHGVAITCVLTNKA